MLLVVEWTRIQGKSPAKEVELFPGKDTRHSLAQAKGDQLNEEDGQRHGIGAEEVELSHGSGQKGEYAGQDPESKCQCWQSRIVGHRDGRSHRRDRAVLFRVVVFAVIAEDFVLVLAGLIFVGIEQGIR